ncbi:MAG: DinB family protein [Ignavibacteria bacterium]|nr:DinB family protein [Ignavibacteria bacterium]
MNALIENFLSVVKLSESKLNQINEEQSSARPSENGWSPKEILGHLIDSACNNHRRFVLAQFTEDLKFPGYEQNGWVKVQTYQNESWNDLIQLWKYYNLHIIHLIKSIPENELKKLRKVHNLNEIAWKKVEPNESVTLEYFIEDYFGHMKHHLSQIFYLVNGE